MGSDHGITEFLDAIRRSIICDRRVGLLEGRAETAGQAVRDLQARVSPVS